MSLWIGFVNPMTSSIAEKRPIIIELYLKMCFNTATSLDRETVERC